MIKTAPPVAPNPWRRSTSPLAALAAFALALASVAFSASEAQALEPLESILRWDFEEADEPGTWEGGTPQRDAAGPRPPRHPGHEIENRAAYFAGRAPFLLLKDHERGGETDLRFRAGETFAMEAWVRLESLGNGHAVYLLGKGRHGERGEGLPEQNQNYAVRIQGDADGPQLGFLFASADPERDGAREWHRWWSEGRLPAQGWNHVAISYTFGDGASLRAWINGELVEGVWDMGGQTDLPPVTDHDDLVIGTGSTRTAGTSFTGWIDQLAIYRGEVPAEQFASRYQFLPPPPAVTREMLEPGRVLVQVSEEGVEPSRSWPLYPEVTESWQEEVFGFIDWPQKYISTGVRADRANPAHFRASALVELPPGRHRILLRGRGASRLHIDGEMLLETPFPPADTAGHGKLSEQDEYLDLGPDFRFAPPGNREAWVEFESGGGEHFVVLETLIGGVAGRNFRRPEFGETVVAISPEGEESWQLLNPAGLEIPYTDEGWAPYEADRRAWLAETNTQRRAESRAEHAAYWGDRRAAAQAWLASVGEVPVPELPEGFPAHNAIDHFLGARIAEVAAESVAGGGVDYHREVKPLLEAKCHECHTGGKAKGGLRLDLKAKAFAGGEYDGPGIVPGAPEESSLVFRVGPEADDDIMPPKGAPLSEEEVALLERWIGEGAAWPAFDVRDFEPTPLAGDLEFLRRLHLDLVGVPPVEGEIERFLAADEASRRSETIDRLLVDPRWADRWMGYWQDVLAENPNIINPTLNNTGPFRWWLHESLLDNKPADLFVTELVRLEGSERFGGPAGFGTASSNDAPFAEKGMILAGAFLGVEMKCARCHDAMAHVSLQEDLFNIAAMLAQGPVDVPETSSVPLDRIHEGGRVPLIQVTLEPGTKVEPRWPFEGKPGFGSTETARALAEDPANSRDLLAAHLTAPENERFAQVLANRLWQRLMGRGLVESLGDWEMGEASHPELLAWLGRELVGSGYDLKHLARLVLESHAYQRAVDPRLSAPSPLYVAAASRRLEAEQIVDSLFSATGKPFELEEVSLDIDSVRVFASSITLGKPERAWMLASTSNERDRPSLSLPRITAVSSLMETFGWRGARQDPVSLRDGEANLLQPAILANGDMGAWLTRLSDDHGVTALALEEQSLERLLERLYLRLLTRTPSEAEWVRHRDYLAEGYESRVVPPEARPRPEPAPREPERYVTWSNHVDGPANALALEKEIEARRGAPPTEALEESWRLRLEDVLWAVLNSPEFIYTP